MRCLIIGGDKRHTYLAALAAHEGWSVELLGHGGTRLQEATPTDTIIMPFPFSEIDGHAPAPLSEEPLPMDALAPLIQERALVLARMPGAHLSEILLQKNCRVIDPNVDEGFTMRNAIPSAEGAMAQVMERLPCCLSGTRCAVVGYGRIGRALALRLKGLCASPIVIARSETARVAATGDGFPAITFEEMGAYAPFRVLFNTVPAPVLNAEHLGNILPHGIAIDLASSPYGFDLEDAHALGIDAWRAPGIPGVYAPETAAEAMLALLTKSVRT